MSTILSVFFQGIHWIDVIVAILDLFMQANLCNTYNDHLL